MSKWLQASLFAGFQAAGSATQAVIQSGSTLSGSQGIRKIAEETGGKAFLNVNDISIPLRLDRDLIFRSERNSQPPP